MRSKDGTVKELSYDTVWYEPGVPWTYDIQYRCKICPDAIGELADVSCPDGWVMENGKPVHKEAPGQNVFVARTEGMIDGEETIPRLIGEGRVDGVLLQVGDAMRPEDLHIFLNGALPLVVINSVHPGHVGSVTLDDARGIRMATEHLIALGHTRIGFVGGLPRSDSARRREQGFRDAMADAGLVRTQQPLNCRVHRSTVSRRQDTRLAIAARRPSLMVRRHRPNPAAPNRTRPSTTRTDGTTRAPEYSATPFHNYRIRGASPHGMIASQNNPVAKVERLTELTKLA